MPTGVKKSEAMLEISDEEHNAAMDRYDEMCRAEDAREISISATYAADVRALYNLWTTRTGVSEVTGEILKGLQGFVAQIS